MPASSPSVRSTISACQPRISAQRRYMRSSMSAQSCDSVPPAPAWMARMAFAESCGPASIRSNSIWSSRSRSAATSPLSSSTIEESSRASSAISEASRISSARVRHAVTCVCKAVIRCMMRWACCGSSQKPSTPDCALSSVMVVSLLARSKTLLRDFDALAEVFENVVHLLKHRRPSVCSARRAPLMILR